MVLVGVGMRRNENASVFVTGKGTVGLGVIRTMVMRICIRVSDEKGLGLLTIWMGGWRADRILSFLKQELEAQPDEPAPASEGQ
jgi:hypothetical protein